MKKILAVLAVVLLCTATASAQDKGQWAVGPKMSVYTNTGFDGAIFGIGAMGRYSFTDNLRIEPSIVALCKRYCSVDISANMHYLFDITSGWQLYPSAGLSANDLGRWSCGFNLGAGTDFSIARNLDLTADFKWMIQTAEYHKNPIVISIGATYKF